MLGTATLEGWRGIKALRHLVRDGTALLQLASGLRHLVRAGTAWGKVAKSESMGNLLGWFWGDWN